MSMTNTTTRETIATFSDGSGIYQIDRHGSTLITTILNHDTVTVQERFESTLTRISEFDSLDSPDYVLTDSFSVCNEPSDIAPIDCIGIAWIDSRAYLLDYRN